MCGIVGFTGNSNAVPFLIEGLSRLEYRGYDSAGLALLNKGDISIEKTTERIKSLDKTAISGSLGIGHTRWATHGEPTRANAHPHLSHDKKFAVVHNGIIENYAELREELMADGVEFISQTDTEVIPHLLSKYYNGDFLDAVIKTVSRLGGSYALGVICNDFPDTLIAVKRFSPLVIGLGNGENYIASDVTAIIEKTRDTIYLEDGQIAVATPDSVNIFSIDRKSVPLKVSHIDWDISAAEKSGFEHFMLKEIYEQPDAARNTVNSYCKDGKISFDRLSVDSKRMAEFTGISIVACGSAYHAGLVGRYVFEELLRLPVSVDLASEFRYRNPPVSSKTLAVFISQSGETADTLAALEEAKRRGAHTLAIVNVVGSSIAKAADDVIYTHAGPEIAVATTKGYSTQLIVLYLFGIWVARELKSCDSDMLDILFDGVLKLPETIQQTLERSDNIKQIAHRLCRSENIFFIGRNIDYAAALECALKLKEISYIHSEAYAAGELKHGTISLIEKGTPVFALCGFTPLIQKTVSNAKEVISRGAYVTAASMQGQTVIETCCDQALYIPQVHPLLVASVEIIPFQLFAYFVAKERDCDIDKPRNLAKSVTVE